jgi:hypothetical protein
MKRSKFSEAQVSFILRQVDEGATVGEVCRKAGFPRRHSTSGARNTPA